MSRSSGTYYLIKENVEEDKIEIFNFEIMDFARVEKRGVALSTIDSLTSFFEDGKALERYLKKDEVDDDEVEYEYKILCKNKREKEDIYLPVIWNDTNISSLSKLANGIVDYTSEYNFELMNKIISDNNKKIVALIAHSDKEVPLAAILDAFKSYKEVRALYLNYRDNEMELLQYNQILKKLKL